MALETGKNCYRNSGVWKDREISVKSSFKPPRLTATVFPLLGLAALTQSARPERGTARPPSAALRAPRECFNLKIFNS